MTNQLNVVAGVQGSVLIETRTIRKDCREVVRAIASRLTMINGSEFAVMPADLAAEYGMTATAVETVAA